MNIKQTVFASYIEEDIEYRWIVYDADNLDTLRCFLEEGHRGRGYGEWADGV